MRSWPSNQPTDWQRMGFLAILIFTALSQTCKGSFWKVLYLISCMRILVSLLCVSWRLFLYINFIFQEIVFVEVSSLIPCLIFGLFFTSLIRSDQAESFIWINIVSIFFFKYFNSDFSHRCWSLEADTKSPTWWWKQLTGCSFSLIKND